MDGPQRSTCLVCDRPPHIRGLCPRCYSEASTATAEETTTEQEFVQRGLMLPPHSRKKVGPLMAALAKSRADAAGTATSRQVPEAEEPQQQRMDSFNFVCDVGSDVKKDWKRGGITQKCHKAPLTNYGRDDG